MSTEQQKRADKIGELIAEIEIDGVKAERERAAAVLTVAIADLLRRPRARDAVFLADKLADCRDKIDLTTAAPAPEPMTVGKVLRKMRAGYPVWEDWDDCEKDLVALVDSANQEQARRDAEICSGMAGTVARRDCRDAILKAAGLG